MYLFGPVLSRRLGRSLGIDLVPAKTCSLDCIYCECGRTTRFLDRPAPLVPLEDVIRELDEYLGGNPELDYCTFSGSGEPTLHDGIGRVIDFIKDNHPRYRVAVLTNSTMFFRDDVRKSLMRADLLVPSLDAVSPEVFGRLLRPAEGITAEKTVLGLELMALEYKGELAIEVFIVPGLNDTPEELALIGSVLRKINPTRVELNSLDRPGTEISVRKAKRERLEEIASLWKDIPVSIIGRPSGGGDRETVHPSDAVLETIRRRPSTADDLAAGLGLDMDTVMAVIAKHEKMGKIIRRSGERGVFFQIA